MIPPPGGFATNLQLFKSLLLNLSATAPLLRLVPPSLLARARASGRERLCNATVDFNVEHNLVLPGGRDAQGARPGICPDRVTSADGTPYLVRLKDAGAFLHSDVVVEYSRPNIEHLARSGHFTPQELSKLVYIPPLPWTYAPGAAHTRDVRILVTFSSDVGDPRRRQLVAQLREQGINVTWATGLPPSSAAMRALLDRTRILLNVHQTPHHHTLEEFRLLPALSRGVVVVSEAVPLREAVPYGDQLLFAPYEQLVESVRAADRDYDQIFERIHGAAAPTRALLQKMREDARVDLAARLQALQRRCARRPDRRLQGVAVGSHPAISSTPRMDRCAHRPDGHLQSAAAPATAHVGTSPGNETQPDLRLPPSVFPATPSYDRLLASRYFSSATLVRQHPINCSGVDLLVVPAPLRGQGLGSTLHVWSQHLRNAWGAGRVAVLSSDVMQSGWQWAEGVPGCNQSRGFECLFLPLSSPACVRLAREHPRAPAVVWESEGSPRRPSSQQWPLDLEALRYLLRPSPWFRSWLSARYAEFWGGVAAGDESGRRIDRESLISVHIRWGDKMIEAGLKPVSTYVESVLRVVTEQRIANPLVFLSSEDGSAVELFEQAAGRYGLRIVSFAYDRPRMNCGGINLTSTLGLQGKGVEQFRPPGASYLERWKQTHHKGVCPHLLNYAREHDVPLGPISLLNLFLALESKYVVCDTASNWCRLLHELADEVAVMIPLRVGPR